MPLRVELPCRITGGSLDLDHIRTEIPELLTGVGAHDDRGQFDDAESFQGTTDRNGMGGWFPPARGEGCARTDQNGVVVLHTTMKTPNGRR